VEVAVEGDGEIELDELLMALRGDLRRASR